MTGTAVTQQTPVPLRRLNQVQATGDEDVAEGVLLEEAFAKDVAEKLYTSTA